MKAIDHGAGHKRVWRAKSLIVTKQKSPQQSIPGNRALLPFRTVMLSIIGLWLCYFVLISLRGSILAYEIQQTLGLDLQQAMLWRRALVSLAGIAVTTCMWLILRLFENRAMWLKIVVALLVALPAAGLIAQANLLIFAPVQMQLDARRAAMSKTDFAGKDSGSVLDDVSTRESSAPADLAGRKARARARADAGQAGMAGQAGQAGMAGREQQQAARVQWMGLLEIAIGRYFVLLAWAALFLALVAGVQVHAAQRREERFRSAAKAAELRSLRYQVNPHFLFNALNSLSALVMTGKPQRAEAMIQAMSNFYRHSLADSPTSDVAVEDEFALQRHYLEIEGVRFPDRLIPVFDLPAALAQARIPGMILQPLVENSVKYAVAQHNRPVQITVCAREDYGRLAIAVCDDGSAPPDDMEHGFGIGLANVRDRLEARFGKEANISFGPTAEGFCTEIRLPLRFHD